MKPCKKIAYKDHDLAIADLHRINNCAGENEKPKRAYLCDRCNKWHLTKAEIDTRLFNTNQSLKFYNIWRTLL